MKLHLADYHLLSCRLNLEERKLASALEDLRRAESIAHRMRYRRRYGEMDQVRERMFSEFGAELP
jgi:hypothetical protein